MQNLVITQSWSATLPEGWSQSSDEECITLEGASPIGALQISSYTKDGPISEQDLAEFAEEHLSAGAHPVQVTFGDYTGFRVDYGTDDFFCQEWYLRHVDQMLFITYTCPIDSRTLEEPEIFQVLSSLAPRGGA
jgi:hypothetical protein